MDSGTDGAGPRQASASRILRPCDRYRHDDHDAGDQDRDNDDQVDKSDPPENPFADGRLKDLWDRGLEANNRYWLIRQLVRDGERQLPPQWGLPISITECSIHEGKRLCWRGRIWLPFFEPLRAQVIQETHESSLSGHPGRDLTKMLISRRFTWPGLSQDVRKFLRNCDVCGRNDDMERETTRPAEASPYP